MTDNRRSFTRKFRLNAMKRGRRWRCMTVFLTFLVVGLDASAAQQNAISLGLYTQIPPFMWEDGKSLEDISLGNSKGKRWFFLQSNLDQTASWGGRWNIVVVRQWVDGEGNFARLRRIVNEHKQRGLAVVMRVLEDPAVYDRLTNAESTEFGFDREYFRWVQALARTFGGDVQYFLIGNEAELDVVEGYGRKAGSRDHLQLTYDLYAKVLKTAVKAIKSINPQLRVANSGFSDKSPALALAQEINETHGLGAAQKFWEDWKSRGGIKAEGKLRLHQLLKDPNFQRQIEFVRRAVREPMGSDIFQLHYYGGWRAMQPMLDWINKEMRAGNAVRPILAAEVGYRIYTNKVKGDDGKTRWEPDWSYYSEDEHAQEIVKNFATLFGNDVRMALYWSMRESTKYGLVLRLFPPTDDPGAFKVNRASRAFRMLGETLNGARSAPARLPPRLGLREFHFIGASDVSLVWSDGEDISTFLRGAAQIRDIEGNVVAIGNGLKSLTGPLYLYWPPGTISESQPQNSVPK